jgi:AraC-like DNA-binding protein
MENKLFNILLKEDYYLYNSIFAEQHREHDSIFNTPYGGREGGNGLVYLFSGEIHYYVKDVLVHKAHEGDVVFLSKLSNYWCKFFKGKNESVCHFGLLNFEILDESFSSIKIADAITVCHPTNTLPIRNKMVEAIRVNKRGMISPALIKSKAYGVLTDIAMDISQQKKSTGSYSAIEPGLSFLEHHFTENTHISELAEMCFISETSFRRLFVQYAGMSPTKYRNVLRINRAKELLKSGFFSLEEISDELGFFDIAHFYRIFKNIEGTNPGKYKKDNMVM